MDNTAAMLKLLKKLDGKGNHWQPHVRQIKPYVFYTEGLFLVHGDLDFYKDWDERSVTINFNDQTISWTAAYHSRHNGSSFGEITKSANWDEFMKENYARAVSFAKETIAKEIRAEQEAEIKKREEAAVESRLLNILSEVVDDESI